MNDPRTLRVHIEHHGRRGTILVDEQDISTAVQGYTITGRVGRPPEVKLDVLTTKTVLDGTAIVTISDTTRDALIALGWTPPTEEQ